MNKHVIGNILLNMVGVITIEMIGLATDQYFGTSMSIGITTGSLITITILYNAIKCYIKRKKEEIQEIRIEHELIEDCLNEIAGIKCTIKEMMNNK